MRYIVRITLSNDNAIEVGVEAKDKLDALRQFVKISPVVEDKIEEIASGASVTGVSVEEDEGQSYAVNSARLININPN